MAKRARRSSVVVHHNTDDLDARFKIKRGVSRKVLRKQQRTLAKQQHHQNRLNYNARRKNKALSNTTNLNSSSDEVEIQENATIAHKKQFQLNEREQLEIDYLEKKLLKGKKSKSSPNVFHQLKKEFLNDGFDEDFIDFLANIQDAAPEQEILRENDNQRESKQAVKEIDNDHSDIEADTIEKDENVGPVTHGVRKVRFDLPGENDTAVIESHEHIQSTNLNIDDLCRQQMGLINRLSDGNVNIVTDDVIKLYEQTLGDDLQPHDVLDNLDKLINNLCKIIVGTIIEDTNTVISLVAVQTFLVCALCNRIGVNIGYIFAHVLYKKFLNKLSILE